MTLLLVQKREREVWKGPVLISLTGKHTSLKAVPTGKLNSPTFASVAFIPKPHYTPLACRVLCYVSLNYLSPLCCWAVRMFSAAGRQSGNNPCTGINSKMSRRRWGHVGGVEMPTDTTFESITTKENHYLWFRFTFWFCPGITFVPWESLLAFTMMLMLLHV